MPADEQHRRASDDAALQTLGIDVALLKQAARLTEETNAARNVAVVKSIELLVAETKATRSSITDGFAEAKATPMGRAIEGRLDELEGEAEASRAFRLEVRGAIRTIKGTAVILGGISAAFSIIALVISWTHPGARL